MRFSTIRAGAAAVAASIAFAACAGHGIVPSSSSLPGATGDALQTLRPAKSNPCSIALGPWTFGGSCGVVKLTSSGGTTSLAKYKGIGVMAKLASGAPNGTVFVFHDATGKGDITGKPAFPAFTTGGKAFLYIAALNGGKAFTFNGTPNITITNASAFPGKTCVLGELSKTLKWTAEPLPSHLSGHTLTFPSVPFKQQVPAGAFFLGFACK